MDRVEKIMTQPIEINSEKIHYVVVRDGSLEVALHGGERWIHQMISPQMVNAFLNSQNKDEFYEESIKKDRQIRSRILAVGSSKP